MIDGQTKIFGILGRPVAHSLSPVMHNAAFRHLGVNAVYVAFPVTDLARAVSGLRGLGIGGVSVTIPFKEEIIPLLDELDPQAARIGAVNTVVNRDGRLTGYNTDWLGAVTALTAKISLKGRHVLILGAGGASRAITYGIIQTGGQVSLTDVDQARAAALVKDLGGEAIPLNTVGDCPATILVNATPVGMAPDIDGIPLNPDLLGRFEVVMDIVTSPYKPDCSGKLRRMAAPPSTACKCLSTRPRRSLSCGPAKRLQWRSWPGRLMKLWERNL